MITAISMVLNTKTTHGCLNFRRVLTISQILRFVLYRKIAELP